MNDSIEAMLAAYAPRTSLDRKNALAEIIQEIALCGLSRAGFFKEAAFYGGTALRIFHGIDRFSEDLDFSLVEPNEDFDLSSYLEAIEQEALSYGFLLQAEKKEKTAETQIQSAFINGDTLQHLLTFFPSTANASDATQGEKIRVKLEIDTNPAPSATFERRYRLLPAPYEAQLYDTPSLFAGKIHAILCRGWKSRVKGRDFYDYTFYVSRGTNVNIKHLEAKLRQTGNYDSNDSLTLESLKEMLYERFSTIDFENAKQDVEPFLPDTSSLALWSSDFFSDITNSLR